MNSNIAEETVKREVGHILPVFLILENTFDALFQMCLFPAIE